MAFPPPQVMELGAGFHGLPSLACAAAGAKAVRCTESEATALRQLEINVKVRESGHEFCHGEPKVNLRSKIF